MRMTATGAMKTREDARKLGGFGQMWKPGDQITVYYPLVRDESGKLDLLVGGCWGHPADPKQLGLKTIFIPSLTDIDESGVPVGKPDITYQFARIAKAFVEGEKQQKVDKCMAKSWPSEAARKSALEAIDAEFDTQNNAEAKKAVVGKLTLLITTECVVVPIKNDEPMPAEARLVTQSLSNDKIRKLLAILNDKKYAPSDDKPYLEVQYTFPAKDKKAEAGKVDPVGQTPEYRLESRYPDHFKTIESLLIGLPESSETIERRNFSYRKFEEKQIMQALTTYSIMQSEFLDSLSDEEDIERLAKSAATLDALSITKSLANEQLKMKITEELDKIKTAHPEDLVALVDREEPTFSTGAPSIEALMTNPNRADDSLAEGLEINLEQA